MCIYVCMYVCMYVWMDVYILEMISGLIFRLAVTDVFAYDCIIR